MSILDRSIRSLSSCDEALEDEDTNSADETLHRVCSRDTLDGSDSIIAVNPVCYSTDNLAASTTSLMRPFADTDDDLDDRGSCERLVNYHINDVSDSEDDDDVYQPDWKIYEEFQSGVLEDQRHDDLLADEHQPLSTVWMKCQVRVQEEEDDLTAAEEARQMCRKRHYRLGHTSSDLEDLVNQLEVMPAKIRRIDSNLSSFSGGSDKDC